MKYNKPIIVEPTSSTFFRVCNLKYNNNPFNGCIEFLLSRSEGRVPSLLHIGVCASRSADGLINIGAALTISGSETSNIVYRDSDYLYIKIKAYYMGYLSYIAFRGSCEMIPVDVAEGDLTLVL